MGNELMRVHPDFKKLLRDMKADYLKKGKDMTYSDLTKLVIGKIKDNKRKKTIFEL